MINIILVKQLHNFKAFLNDKTNNTGSIEFKTMKILLFSNVLWVNLFTITSSNIQLENYDILNFSKSFISRKLILDLLKIKVFLKF